MALKTVAAGFAILLFAVVGYANTEEQLGVKVYPGATADLATTKALTQSMSGIKAFCYTTSDGVEKVAEFYKKEGLKYMGGDKENAMFQKGSVDVTIQNPWMDMKTGKLVKSTLISVVTHRPQ